MDSSYLRFALEHKDREVGICLLQDAVYLGCKGKNGKATLADAIARGIPVFAAQKDVELRGLGPLIHPKIKALDYGDIIDLVLNYERVINI
jgi:sulfur relay protein TusB/DsrH